jgi:hypothetical protein
MTRLDPFNANTEPEPPDRKFAQVKQGMGRSEGHSVVAADVGRQAALLKKPLKHSESVVFPGRRKGLTSEQKTAGVIGDRQRVAVLAIPQQELAFVVGAPKLIGPLPQRQRSALRTTTQAAAPLDQAMAIEHGVDGAFGRDRNTRESAEQSLADFASPPAGVLALQVQNVTLYLKRELVGVAIRAPASRRAGEPQTAFFRPSPNTPSKASLPPH